MWDVTCSSTCARLSSAALSIVGERELVALLSGLRRVLAELERQLDDQIHLERSPVGLHFLSGECHPATIVRHEDNPVVVVPRLSELEELFESLRHQRPNAGLDARQI